MAAKPKQNGAALVEFAFILPALLLLLYGLVVYSVLFVTQQAVAYGAQRGAEAVVVVNPEIDGYEQQVAAVAKSAVRDVIGYLPGTFASAEVCADEADEPRVCVGSSDSGTHRQVRVTVQYPFSNWNLPAPAFLPLPANLAGVGVTRVQK